MKGHSTKQNSLTKRFAAGLLAVWLSGIVFLFCCGAPANSQAKTAKTESCPLAKMGDCDKSGSDKTSIDENALRFETASADCPALNCCGFLPQIFDRARKAEPAQQIAAVSERPSLVLPAFIFVKAEQKVFFPYRPRPLNRSGTYLKNQVFRI